ncbi:hypothetical protein AMAG_07533 [Allomyces macrogynus ATCC 38327]|uniref:Uncharacterized protein n=1 Tax=Allomyces macrogynus (strain ATCC 38327) TaxID=578462 RepID=A0A0L0SIW7_ALLM3|nr:hypothetical protein AMAG_07533 [Allomyces macrogynus ATCC 38327]|eukprot:KNE62300.1 hypothetical protein AMAG_07533 [Allomyces macrogynus ATCC 38327]
MADPQPRGSPLHAATSAPPNTTVPAAPVPEHDPYYYHRVRDRADRDWPYAPPLHAAHPYPPPPPSTRDARRLAHDYHPHHANYAPAPADPYAAPAHPSPPRHDLPYARPAPPGAAYPYAPSASGMTAPPPPHYPYGVTPPAGPAADTWARDSPTDAGRQPADTAVPAAAAPPRAPHPDEYYARQHPYYPAADPAYSGYPPPYGWHGPPPPWAAYNDAAHHAWRYPPGAARPPPPIGRARWPPAGEPYAAEPPYAAAQYPADASYPVSNAPYVKPDPNAPYPVHAPPPPPPGPPAGPPAYAWAAPAAAHEAAHDPARYAGGAPAASDSVPPLSSRAAPAAVGSESDQTAGHCTPTHRTGSVREARPCPKSAAAASSAPTPLSRPPSRAVSGGAAEENEGERPRREYVVLTRDLYRAMEASLQDPANPVFPPGMLRKRWRRLMSSFEYHAKNPEWRTLTWKGCLLYIAPQEDWVAIVLDEYHAPPTDAVARHGLDTPAPHRSVTQTFKQVRGICIGQWPCRLCAVSGRGWVGGMAGRTSRARMSHGAT